MGMEMGERKEWRKEWRKEGKRNYLFYLEIIIRNFNIIVSVS